MEKAKFDREAMSLLCQCEDCQEKFRITFGDAVKMAMVQANKKIYNVGGQVVTLTFYDCPKCGRRHFVQIDDDKSKRMFAGVNKQFVQLAAKRHKMEAISKKQSDKFKRDKQNLSDYRRELMKTYTGKEAIEVETGLKYTLVFSV